MKTHLTSPSWRRPTSTPAVRRTHECRSETITYTPAGERPQEARCECGRSWTMQYAASGEPTGYEMRAPFTRVLTGVFE